MEELEHVKTKLSTIIGADNLQDMPIGEFIISRDEDGSDSNDEKNMNNGSLSSESSDDD